MNKWWKDPRLDDEGTYDYLVEELPSDNSRWSWYLYKCDDCGKYHRYNRTDSHYFYCWDGWDSMSYTTCWKCYIKSIIRSSIIKIKKFIQHHGLKIDVGAYKIFRKYCNKYNIPKEQRTELWLKYYDDIWHNKAMHKFVKGVR